MQASSRKGSIEISLVEKSCSTEGLCLPRTTTSLPAENALLSKHLGCPGAVAPCAAAAPAPGFKLHPITANLCAVSRETSVSLFVSAVSSRRAFILSSFLAGGTSRGTRSPKHPRRLTVNKDRRRIAREDRISHKSPCKTSSAKMEGGSKLTFKPTNSRKQCPSKFILPRKTNRINSPS